MKEIVRCVYCGTRINLEKDNYYKVILFLEGKETAKDHAHISCHRGSINNQLSGLIKGVSNLLPAQKEVIIQ